MIPETQDLGIREVPDAEALAIEMGLRMEEVLANVEALREKVGSLWRVALLLFMLLDVAQAAASP